MSFAIITFGIAQNGTINMQAFLVKQPESIPWISITEEEVGSGATIPKNTNGVFHLPLNFTSIDREILLGHQGKKVRYWGYCFPENYDPKITTNREGFPGLMFLSEKEQSERAKQERANEPQFTLVNLPTKLQVESLKTRRKGSIRHQINFFKPGMLCYIQTETALSIGMDIDADGLNNKLESEIGTDQGNPDTDGDGIGDGKEYLFKTSPTLRDTDGDGVIDGVEDKNWNGIMDVGETDARTKDSDRDGLCDGMCRIRLSNGQQIYAGEDKNLNGIVDGGETNPLKGDSRGDKYNDFQRFIKCILDGAGNC
jgi:hypothetical protein